MSDSKRDQFLEDCRDKTSLNLAEGDRNNRNNLSLYDVRRGPKYGNNEDLNALLRREASLTESESNLTSGYPYFHGGYPYTQQASLFPNDTKSGLPNNTTSRRRPVVQEGEYWAEKIFLLNTMAKGQILAIFMNEVDNIMTNMNNDIGFSSSLQIKSKSTKLERAEALWDYFDCHSRNMRLFERLISAIYDVPVTYQELQSVLH